VVRPIKVHLCKGTILLLYLSPNDVVYIFVPLHDHYMLMYSFSCVHMFTQVVNMFNPSPFSSPFRHVHYLLFILCISFVVSKFLKIPFWNILYAVCKYFALLLNKLLVSDCLTSFAGPRSSTPGSTSTKPWQSLIQQ